MILLFFVVLQNYVAFALCYFLLCPLSIMSFPIMFLFIMSDYDSTIFHCGSFLDHVLYLSSYPLCYYIIMSDYV